MCSSIILRKSIHYNEHLQIEMRLRIKKQNRFFIKMYIGKTTSNLSFLHCPLTNEPCHMNHIANLEICFGKEMTPGSSQIQIPNDNPLCFEGVRVLKERVGCAKDVMAILCCPDP